MNAKWKAKWVEALRSGEYVQGKHYLNRDNAYCCLGVLCAIHPDVEEVKTEAEYRAYEYRGQRSATCLPKPFREELGIPVSVGFRLEATNDVWNWTFPQIAEWIDENL